MRTCVDWEGRFRIPLEALHLDASATRRHAAVRLARLDPQSSEIADQAAFYGDGFFHNNIFWPASSMCIAWSSFYRERFERFGHGSGDQAIVGLGGQFFARPNSQDAVREFRPYFDNAPVYGHGPSLEEFSGRRPAHRRQPAADHRALRRDARARGRLPAPALPADHAGLPLETVLEQIEILGTEIVPALRREMAVGRPEHVPEAPTHASLKTAAEAAGAAEPRAPKTD